MADHTKFKNLPSKITLDLSTSNNLKVLEQLSADTVDSTLTTKQLLKYLSNGLLLSISADREAIGFLAYRYVLDEAELDQIVIDKQFHNRGIGSVIIQTWHGLLKSIGINKVFLDVRETNTPAIKLYDKSGYKEIGRRNGYYLQNGLSIDAILMVCDLGSV